MSEDWGPAVLLAQRRLGLPPDGGWTPELWGRVRRFQFGNGLLVTGELDRPTVALLDELAYQEPPVWAPADGWAAADRAGQRLLCDHPLDQL